MELEDHRPPIEREVACVLVRPLDEGAVASWIDVTELSAVPALRDVGDDVELLACVEERTLEREVVARA